jgi:hypothetical protein
MDPLKKVGEAIKAHNAQVPRVSQWQEMKAEIVDTMRDLKEFADKHVTFAFVMYCVFISLLALAIFK